MLIAGLALVVGGFVLRPLLRPSATTYDWDFAQSESRRALRAAEIEREVLRFREALRAGTVCARCSQANPPGSRYCGDCGRPLLEVRQGGESIQVPST